MIGLHATLEVPLNVYILLLILVTQDLNPSNFLSRQLDKANLQQCTFRDIDFFFSRGESLKQGFILEMSDSYKSKIQDNTITMICFLFRSEHSKSEVPTLQKGFVYLVLKDKG